MTIEKIASRARVLLTLLSLIGALMLAAGIVLLVTTLQHAQGALHQDWTVAWASATPAFILGAAGLLTMFLPWAAYPLLAILRRQALDQAWRDEQVLGTLENQRQLLESLRDTASLSDAAKAIAYREKDREALREAIRQDIDKGDFEAASQLVDEMEERFGYKQEAQQLREQIEDGSRAARERQIQDNIHQIDGFLEQFNWAESHRLCVRLTRLYPDHPEVARLPDRIQGAKDNHKRDLLRQWKDAVARDDVNRSVELLKELDQYLTPSEAEAYKESARDVFRKRLQQMGVQFALYVHDKAWSEAVRVGKQITDEFPNTRIAAEVREKMAILLEKANQPTAVQ